VIPFLFSSALSSSPAGGVSILAWDDGGSAPRFGSGDNITTTKLRLAMKYITRIDYLGGSGGRSRGWYVRVPGQPKRMFRDRQYSGLKAALRAAVQYRDSLPPPIGRRRYYMVSARNLSGIIGVTQMRDKHGRPVGWRAFAGSAAYGTWRSRGFNAVKEGGMEKALRAAIRQRKAWEKELKRDAKRTRGSAAAR
jgi:hypothetical protein